MIPLAVPNLGKLEQEYATQAIANGYIGPSGPFVEKFEAMVAKASGRKWAVATITGTAALHASASILNISGVRVDVPENAFPAGANVLRWNMDCVVRHIDGGVCHDWQAYGIWNALSVGIFCDRAPAIGEAPTHHTLECYSFAANKIATCGHGGAITGDYPALEYELRTLIRQGYGLPGKFNYRMADINAAIGCAQMERLDELKSAKKRIWNRYAEHLTMIDRGPSRWMATADLPHSFADQLATQGIECRKEPSGGISLPCSTGLTEKDQDTVLAACMSLLTTARTEAP